MSNSLWLHGPYSPWNSPGENTGVGSCSLLQGIFPTQGLNPGLLHCGKILFHPSHQGIPSDALLKLLLWIVNMYWVFITIYQELDVCYSHSFIEQIFTERQIFMVWWSDQYRLVNRRESQSGEKTEQLKWVLLVHLICRWGKQGLQDMTSP